jgi:Spy/CpxP family protein refolding chaperone
MRSVIRVSAAVLALFIAVNGAEAQGGGGGGGGGRGGDPAQMIQRQVDARMAGITLDAKQKATVDSLSKVMVAEQVKLREGMGAGGDMQAMRAKMTELNTKFYADIKAVLTAEQQAKFDENVKNLPQGRGRGGF